MSAGAAAGGVRRADGVAGVDLGGAGPGELRLLLGILHHGFAFESKWLASVFWDSQLGVSVIVRCTHKVFHWFGTFLGNSGGPS